MTNAMDNFTLGARSFWGLMVRDVRVLRREVAPSAPAP